MRFHAAMYKHFSKEENIATRHKIVIVLSKTVYDFLVENSFENYKAQKYNIFRRFYAPLSLKTAVCHSPATQYCFGYLSALNLWVLWHPVVVHMIFSTGNTLPAGLQHHI